MVKVLDLLLRSHIQKQEQILQKVPNPILQNDLDWRVNVLMAHTPYHHFDYAQRHDDGKKVPRPASSPDKRTLTPSSSKVA